MAARGAAVGVPSVDAVGRPTLAGAEPRLGVRAAAGVAAGSEVSDLARPTRPRFFARPDPGHRWHG